MNNRRKVPPQARRKSAHPPRVMVPLAEFLARRGIRPGWDYLLIGDGSGQGGDPAVGWYCSIVGPGLEVVEPIAGCASGAGLHEVELVPYLHAVLRIKQLEGDRYPSLRIVIVTDRSGLVAAGSRRRPPAGDGRPIWEAFLAAAAPAKVEWVLAVAGTLELNRLADRRSGSLRKCLAERLAPEP